MSPAGGVVSGGVGSASYNRAWRDLNPSPGDTPPSKPPVRWTVRMPARWTSPSRKGRILKIDGGDANPATRNFICAKVRRFDERVYGEDRLLYPAVRQGAKGQGTFVRVSWDEALDLIARKMLELKDTCRRRSDPALLVRRIERRDHARHDRRGSVAAVWHVAARREPSVRLPPARRTRRCTARCRASPTPTIPHARLIILWGVNPGASGIHLIPFLREAQAAGARLVVIDPRRTSLAKQADLHLPVQAGNRSARCARAAPRAVRGRPCRRGVPHGARGRRRSAARAAASLDDRSRRRRSRQSTRRTCGVWRTGTSRPRRRSYGADGAWSGTGMAAAPPPRSSRYRRSPASSVFAAAVSR